MSATPLVVPQWIPDQINAETLYKVGDAVSIGDLLYYDSGTNTMRPAEKFADGGTAAATWASFQPLFAGVANSQQLAIDTVGHVARVLQDYELEFPCVSGTFLLGDYVAPQYLAGLKSQVLDKTTVRAQAIGRTIKAYPVATTRIKVRLTSLLLSGLTVSSAA